MKNRKSIRTYSAATTFAVAGLAAVAAAQPANTDLGTLPNGATNGVFTGTGVAATNVKWYRFVIPTGVTTTSGFLDITCAAGSPALSSADCEIGVYDSAGALKATDDDDGPGNYSELSFGRTSPTRTTITGAVGGNGRDGVLAAGTYYLAVAPFNATFGAASYTVTTTGTATGNVNFILSYSDGLSPTSPSGVGSATAVQPSGSTLLRVTVTPGTNPASTGITVMANLSSIGGSSTQMFFDDGTNGDVTAGDNIFSYSYVVPGSTAAGSYTLPFNIADAQSRSGSGTIPLTVFTAPAADDLGTLPAGSVTTGPTETLAASQVKWYKFTLATGVSVANNNFLDIVSSANLSANNLAIVNDSLIAVYNSGGGVVASDDDDGPDNLSALSFGLTTPTRPNGNGVVFNGRDGSLAAGTYYLALTGYPATFAAAFNAASTSISTGTVSATFTLGPAANTPPTIAGNTSSGLAGGTVLITGTVAPGANPTSTGITVTGNLTNIGGSSTQTFYDDGTHGDVTAGDNIFSFLATLPGSQTSTTVTLTVTDAQSRTGTGTATINVDEAGQTLATARNIEGTGAITSITGALTSGDVDLYRIHLCDPANFSASTVTGSTVSDTQLFLFDATGHGVVLNDDEGVTNGTLLSRITNELVSSRTAGDYYLAVSSYDNDPLDSANVALFPDTSATNCFGTAFRCQQAPNNTNALDHWDNNGTNTGTYTITLTGVNGTACGPICGTADFNGDGDIGTDQDIEAFFACLAGNCCATCFPGGADFNGDGDIGTDQDIEAFFRVLAGNNC